MGLNVWLILGKELTTLRDDSSVVILQLFFPAIFRRIWSPWNFYNSGNLSLNYLLPSILDNSTLLGDIFTNAFLIYYSNIVIY